jgi:hypothetical protein
LGISKKLKFLEVLIFLQFKANGQKKCGQTLKKRSTHTKNKTNGNINSRAGLVQRKRGTTNCLKAAAAIGKRV